MSLNIVTMLISIIIFFILFFGIGFILNMLFRRTWVMALLYPFVALYFIGKFSLLIYFTNPSQGLAYLQALKPTDISILLVGLAGAITAGFVIRLLRNRGYQMF